MRFPSVAYPCASALWIVEVKAVLVGAGMVPQIGTVNDLRPLNYSGNLRHNALLPSFWYAAWKTLTDLFALQRFFFTRYAGHPLTTAHQHSDLVTNFIRIAANDVRYKPQYSIAWLPNKVRVFPWRNGKPQLPLASSLREVYRTIHHSIGQHLWTENPTGA